MEAPMYPTSYNDFKEILTPATILRRFPSVSFEDLFSANKGISMSEGPKDITIEVDMPGLEAKDIQVNLENGLLQLEEKKRKKLGMRTGDSTAKAVENSPQPSIYPLMSMKQK